MNYTQNYQLNQWVESDRVLMEDFNADNEKIDAVLAEMAQLTSRAGNCRIVYGTYAGTGTYGPSNPTTLTFAGKPLVLFVAQQYHFFSLWGAVQATAYTAGNQEKILSLTWEENSVSWYGDAAGWQLNGKDELYYYAALLAADQ